MPDQNISQIPNEDRLLVHGIIHGERKAFGQLIHKYGRLVNSIIYKMTGQTEDREDLAQETFLKVYKYLPTFRFDSKLSTWIGNIAFNLSVNYLKKKKLVQAEDFNLQLINDDDNNLYEYNSESRDLNMQPDELYLVKEKHHLLLAVINQLNPVQRTLVHLLHNEELSLIDISEVTSIPVNTIKSHLYRARKILKNDLMKLLNE